MTRLARSVLLLGMALLIAKLLATGQIRYYLSTSFDGMIAATGLVLLVMGAADLYRGLRPSASGKAGHVGLDSALTLGMLAMPLVAGLLLSPRALGTAGLGGTPVSRLALTFDAGPPPAPPTAPPPPRQPIADVGELMSYLRQAGESGVGQHVRAVGLVAHSDDLPANEFVLVRYTIVHCVADAQPLGFLVVVSDGMKLTGDQWVEVDGTLSSEARDGERLVGIRAQHVLTTEEPTDPYILAY